MKMFTIEKKMSNTGSIHDIASDMYDRVIKFRAGTKFAVVLASFYGDDYTTHKTSEAALRTALRRREYSLQIIDPDGNRYDDNCNGQLVRVDG